MPARHTGASHMYIIFSWADGMFCVAGHGKSGFRGLGTKVKPPHERCEGALSQSALGATALTHPCACKSGSHLA